MTDLHSLPPPRSWLIFTTLDDSLLEGGGHRPDALDAILTELQQHGVPVILNSSKTPREITRIADALRLDTPRIAEYGTVITYPSELRTVFLGVDYDQICEVLDSLRKRHAYRFQGFHDWSVEEVAVRTGLRLETAQVIRQRKASEPLVWEDTQERLDHFRQQLRTMGLELKPDEPFWHVTGQTSKWHAMQFLLQEYARQWGYPPFVIAIGDQPDDQQLLAAADVAVIVRNEAEADFDLPPALLRSRELIRTQEQGAAGWGEAVAGLLARAEIPDCRLALFQMDSRRSR